MASLQENTDKEKQNSFILHDTSPGDGSMEKECEQLWQELLKLQEEIQKVKKLKPAFSTDDLETVNELNLIRVRCKQMKAEIEILKSEPIDLIGDSEVCYEMIYQEKSQDNTGLQDTLSFCRAQRLELEEEIKSAKETQLELEAVVRALKERLQVENREDNSNNRLLMQLEAKLTEAQKQSEMLLRHMRDFIDKHYPVPPEEIFNIVKKKMKFPDDQAMILKDLHPLKTIIFDLMNRCVDSPNDPYITIDHHYWPPYLELLLRCDIVVRHSEDKNRIKLIPFHL
ncbi:hypothetical protein ACJMK2_015771 [Sinanodonta woodiana]|uniref:Centromere protein K n=1 Tax=Sinanodonta woodiana TaxID=1069815 RepID=A0ABD3URE5_SINWO